MFTAGSPSSPLGPAASVDPRLPCGPVPPCGPIPDFHIFFKPALKECFEGRPRNGMFIAIPNTIKEIVTDISPDHWRVQAALIQNKNSNIMIVNSYFLQDSRAPIHIDPELEQVIAVINNLLTNYHFDDVFHVSYFIYFL